MRKAGNTILFMLWETFQFNNIPLDIYWNDVKTMDASVLLNIKYLWWKNSFWMNQNKNKKQ